MLAMEHQPLVAVMPESDIAMPTQAVLTLLGELGVERDQWVRVLGSAFVVASVAPFLSDGLEADEVHGRMVVLDEELAAAVEALAPLLLSRERAQKDARLAVAAAAELLQERRA